MARKIMSTPLIRTAQAFRPKYISAERASLVRYLASSTLILRIFAIRGATVGVYARRSKFEAGQISNTDSQVYA